MVIGEVCEPSPLEGYIGPRDGIPQGESDVSSETDSRSNSNGELTERLAPSPGVRILGVGHAPSRGLRKGVVINIDATISAIKEAVLEAESLAGVSASNAFVSISGAHIQSLNSNGIVAIRNREVTAYDIERVIEAAKAVAVPSDREVLHVLAEQFIVDGQDGIRNPIGIAGVRLECRVHIVTGATASAQNIVNCVHQAGLSVDGLVLGGLASARSVLSTEERELGVCLLDLGGGTTDVVLVNQDGVQHSAVIPAGGNHLTNDVASGLRCPIGAAEDLKKRFGSARLSYIGEDGTVEVAGTGGRPSTSVSKSSIVEILEPRMREIFSLVEREILKANPQVAFGAGIVLTGAGANLAGVAELAEEHFQIPVRIGRPGDAAPKLLSGLTDLARDPEFSCVSGLALEGAERLVGGHQFGKSSSGGRLHRVLAWLAEHF